MAGSVCWATCWTTRRAQASAPEDGGQDLRRVDRSLPRVRGDELAVALEQVLRHLDANGQAVVIADVSECTLDRAAQVPRNSIGCLSAPQRLLLGDQALVDLIWLRSQPSVPSLSNQPRPSSSTPRSNELTVTVAGGAPRLRVVDTTTSRRGCRTDVDASPTRRRTMLFREVLRTGPTAARRWRQLRVRIYRSTAQGWGIGRWRAFRCRLSALR